MYIDSYGLSPRFLFLSLSYHDYNSTSSTHKKIFYPSFRRFYRRYPHFRSYLNITHTRRGGQRLPLPQTWHRFRPAPQDPPALVSKPATASAVTPEDSPSPPLNRQPLPRSHRRAAQLGPQPPPASHRRTPSPAPHQTGPRFWSPDRQPPPPSNHGAPSLWSPNQQTPPTLHRQTPHLRPPNPQPLLPLNLGTPHSRPPSQLHFPLPPTPQDQPPLPAQSAAPTPQVEDVVLYFISQRTALVKAFPLVLPRNRSEYLLLEGGNYRPVPKSAKGIFAERYSTISSHSNG